MERGWISDTHAGIAPAVKIARLEAFYQPRLELSRRAIFIAEKFVTLNM